MNEPRKARGRLTMSGKNLEVTYDIPGMEHDSAELAGGLVWFESHDRHLLATRQPFLLETASGARVRGSIAMLHTKSAAVVVEP